MKYMYIYMYILCVYFVHNIDIYIYMYIRPGLAQHVCPGRETYPR